MEKRTIVAASRNKHKLVEMQAILKKYGMEIISRDDAGIPPFEIEETGDTFEENSLLKATQIMKCCGEITIADDSGLAVDALGGAPGVFSARYAGDPCDDGANNRKLLEAMKDVPEGKRTAKFVSVITMVWPDGHTLVARGECPGKIIFEEKGDGGFGYDPLFVADGFEKTYAQLTADEKNTVSHRAKALAELERQLICQNE
ncbi:MAG: XTP/dITP diphosphatase [Clostridia bacterium]|nr:XTP/dITP diphosphatase [Clostridia bacterium]